MKNGKKAIKSGRRKAGENGIGRWEEVARGEQINLAWRSSYFAKHCIARHASACCCTHQTLGALAHSASLALISAASCARRGTLLPRWRREIGAARCISRISKPRGLRDAASRASASALRGAGSVKSAAHITRLSTHALAPLARMVAHVAEGGRIAAVARGISFFGLFSFRCIAQMLATRNGKYRI